MPIRSHVIVTRVGEDGGGAGGRGGWKRRGREGKEYLSACMLIVRLQYKPSTGDRLECETWLLPKHDQHSKP